MERVKILLLAAMALALACSGVEAQLRVAQNKRYFEDDGKPVVLFGSGLWTIIPDISVDIEDHNTWYAKHGANANRATLFAFFNSVADGQGIGPWARTGPGLANDGMPKFDLTKPDPAFWARVRAYLESCQRHGIYVLLQIFDEPFTEAGEQRWFVNPFNPDNNVNDLPGLPTGKSSGEAQFYDPDNKALMVIQDALVKRLLDETAKHFGNVIYEIGNEINMDSVTSKAARWQQHWINFFRAYERDHGEALLLSNDTRRELLETGMGGFQVVNHHGFVDVRIKGASTTIMPFKLCRAITADFKAFDLPILNSRPCSDPDRKNYGDVVGEEEGRSLYWSYFFSGGHIIGFRTTKESWKDGLKAERIIEALRRFIDATRFWEMEPHPELVGGEALCLASLGQEYGLYLPVGGEISLDLSQATALLKGRWYNPRTGEWAQRQETPGGRKCTLVAPGAGDWALHIRRERSPENR